MHSVASCCGRSSWRGLQVMNTEKERVVQAVQARVQAVLGSTLSAQDSLATSLTASCPRDRDAVLGFLLSAASNRLVDGHLNALALKDDEWEVLFGSKSVHLATATLTDVCEDASFKERRDEITEALRYSLTEPVAQSQWKKPAVRAACYLALHGDNAEERISSTLGGLVKSDSRRLEDVRSVVEDDGADEMLLARAALALSASVCSR